MPDPAFSVAHVAARLGVSARTIRRHVSRLGLPKLHDSTAPGRWARVLLSPATVDAIAAAVSKGTAPRPTAGVQPATAQDSPGQSTPASVQPWTIAGQDSGQPRPTLAALDNLDQLAASIRSAVKHGVLDALREHEREQRPRRSAGGNLYLLATVSAVVVISLAVILGTIGPA